MGDFHKGRGGGAVRKYIHRDRINFSAEHNTQGQFGRRAGNAQDRPRGSRLYFFLFIWFSIPLGFYLMHHL